MASGQWSVVLRHVQRLFNGGSVSGLSEGQLLERFATGRDEVAFGAILARHGPMVLGICRDLLDDPHDVDDAFQATFLVLVKKAAGLRDGDRLAQWLYGVARKVALRARAESSRRKARERPEAGESADPHPTLDAELRELQSLIREEVDRLSSHDRMAVVLCYLEGLTHEEAADRLGWPIGTVKGRLSRARGTLRDRLTRRGVSLPTVALADGLARGSSTAVPAQLFQSTILAAIRLASGQPLTAGIVSAQAITLMEGAIGTMISAQMKLGAAALVVAGVVAVPGVLAYQGQGPVDEARKESAKISEKSTIKPTVKGFPDAKESWPSPEANRQEEARLAEEAIQTFRDTLANGKNPPPPLDQIYLWSRRLAEAQIPPLNSQADRSRAIRAHRDRMQHHLELVTELVKGERYSNLDLLEAKFQLLEAERWLREGSIGNPDSNPGVGGPGGMAIGPGGGFGGGLAKGGGFGGGAGMGIGGGPGVGMGRVNPAILNLNQSPADEKRNVAILAKLEEPLSMHFGSPTPLSDLLKYIKDATQDEAAGFPTGLPIYLDPEGLKEAEATYASTITIQLEGVPLRSTLRLALRQLGLDFRVDGGIVLISDLGDIVMQEAKASRMAPPKK